MLLLDVGLFAHSNTRHRMVNQ